MITFASLMDLELFLKGKITSNTNENDSGIYYLIEENVIVIDPNKLSPFRKAPEITFSLILNDAKLLEAINNKYIPIINKETREQVFNESEFKEYRKRISGISDYDTGNFIFSDNLYFEGLDKYLDQIDDNEKRVRSSAQPVYEEIINIFASNGLTAGIGSDFQGDVQLIEAGSTSRFTNVPSENVKWDFDFTIRIDEDKVWQVKNILENNLDAGGHITQTSKYKVRLTDVTIPGLSDKIDIDFSLTPQKEKYLSTEDALNKRFNNMKQIDNEKYKLVIANIMYAKDFLKKKGAYKPSRGILDGDRANGGLGGVGIENWLLQYGGSFINASKDFLEHSEGKEFKKFEQDYSIMDPGCNHVGKSKREWPYDNFVVNNMRYLGYENMTEALSEFIKSLDESSEKGAR